MGKFSEAEAEYRAALAIEQKLADENPAVTVPRSNLALCRHAYGDLLVADGQTHGGGGRVPQGAGDLMQKLADDNPAVTDFRTPGEQPQSLGSLLLQTGKPAEAEAEYRGRWRSEQKLADDNPADVYFRSRLVDALWLLGDAVRLLGRPAEARDLYQRAIALAEPWVKDPTGPIYGRRELFGLLWRRGLTLRDLGNPAGAAADIRRALGLYDLPKESPGKIDAAYCYSALAGLAGRDGSGVSAAEGEAAAARAVESLRQLVSFKYRGADELRTEPALDPLRSRPDFQLLMRDVAFPFDAFKK